MGSIETKKMKLLKVNNLRVYFYENYRFFRALDGISFSIAKGEFFALIGESGSGKTVTALSILGLLENSPGIIGGSIIFEKNNLLDGLQDHCKVVEKNGEIVSVQKELNWLKAHQKRVGKLRGNKIAIIFQEPYSSLDPYYTVGDQITEVLYRWNKFDNDNQARELTEYWLHKVAIKNPKIIFDSYPHELSGGMCQRVMIALALCCEPDLLIADEPTTALDVTIQKEIMLLLQQLRETFNLSVLFITHDITIVRSFADKIAVLYRGRLVESGTSDELQNKSEIHPFTESLLFPIAKMKKGDTTLREQSSFILAKFQPDHGCIFYSECIPRLRKCKENNPPKFSLSQSHRVYCWLHDPRIRFGEKL